MKNLKSLITNVALLVFGVLTFVFMSQAYLTGSYAGITYSTNGFDMIDFSANVAKYDLLAISNVFVCLFVALVMVVAIANLLVSFGVIKNEKVAKILNIVSVVSAVLMLVFAVCAIASLASIVSDVNKLRNVYSIGWACILNVVLAALTLVVCAFEFVSSRKSK